MHTKITNRQRIVGPNLQYGSLVNLPWVFVLSTIRTANDRYDSNHDTKDFIDRL